MTRMFLSHGWMNTDFFFEHESLEYRMFWAHGWTRIYRADGIIQWSGGKRLLPFGQWVFDKSRLIRAIRVQKNKWSGGKNL